MKARVLSPTPENLNHAAQILKQGDIIGIPTETVYGLAGAIFNEKALLRIFSVKERPYFDPLIVHVYLKKHDLKPFLSQLEDLELIDTSILNTKAKSLAERLLRCFWPGPFTLVLPKNGKVPDLATSGLSTVALRMPSHPITQQLIELTGSPIAAPSANRFGRISPTKVEDVLLELGDRIDFIMDGGPCSIGVESTVGFLDPHGELTLLRPGAISKAMLEEQTGKSIQHGFHPNLSKPAALAAPGMLKSHYAPRKPLFLLPNSIWQLNAEDKKRFNLQTPKTIGLLLFQGSESQAQAFFEDWTGLRTIVHSLTEQGDLEHAARNLFSGLRYLDNSSAEILFAEPCPTVIGLGHAIVDRLQRAASG